VIERYDATFGKWKVISMKCTGTCRAPSTGLAATAGAYNGMCRLRCCVPGAAMSRARILWIAAAVVVIAVVLYWILRMLVFSEAAP
jgi:hypothetical protein